jgi:hypothetical protein
MNGNSAIIIKSKIKNMEKIFLTEHPGKFFDVENAEEFKSEKTKEVLYCTTKENWVLTNGPFYFPDTEVKELTPEEAALWLQDNGYDFDDIPADLQDYCGEEI